MPKRSRHTALVIHLRSARSRKIDLALALAMLDKAVRAHKHRHHAQLFRLPFPAPIA
ncbi:MAG TPA: hypothetical protein VMI34_16875 [Candidatus Bathyarchaeia archaeon]|nr:hypothetical protein [Candidatus Bathyarchaeia archaeon]